MLNGAGLRVVLFVSGCTHNCPECHNPQTHDFDSGIPFTNKERDEIFHHLSQPHIKGITLTGGDPLHPYNAPTILGLCRDIKTAFPNKDIWVYTGYRFEELCSAATHCLAYVDVLVDGRYVKEQRDGNAPYVGSRNQRIIDIPRSIQNRSLILLNT